MKSCLYYSNWSVYAKKHYVNDIPISLVTHLFYAFIGIDATTGKLTLTDSWADLENPQNDGNGTKGALRSLFKLKKSNRNLKTCMSIGGWGTSHLFREVTGNPTKLRNFIDSSMTFLIEYGFDGIDIDWEYPETEQESLKFVELIQLLRQALNKISPNLLLTCATSASSDKIKYLDLASIDKFVSFYNVMTYDFAGSWSANSGYHCNLFGHNGDNQLNCSSTLDEYTKSGISSSKLVLGMPNYGRSFTVCKCEIGQLAIAGKGADGEPGVFPYKLLPLGGDLNTEMVDLKKVSAYCFEPETETMVVYDNPQTTRIKAQFIVSNHYGGGMRWVSSDDNYQDQSRSLLWNFVDQVGELEYQENQLKVYGESEYLKEENI